MMNQSDSHIIAQVLAGRTRQFDMLVDRYSRQIFAMVVRIVDCKEDAEEITHDVFLKAFRNLQRFNGTSSFATWLYRIAYNTAVSAVRKQSREMNIPDGQWNAISDTLVDEALDDLAVQRIDSLHRAIARLSPDERAVITLYYMDELPVAEIASITGMTVSNVKVRLMRTRKKLYLLMIDDDEK